MVEAIQAEDKPIWLDQIRNRFLHPTSESFAAYGNTVLGEDDEDDVDGSTQGAVNEPVNEPVDVEVEVPVETTEQLETRRKKKLDKSEGKEKKAEENVAETPRAGEKHSGPDPDDNATLTEMMKKKALEDKKRKLDEQAVAMLASKRAKLQKENPPAPSESEVDMNVFSVKRGNLLEEIYIASAPQGWRRWW
ncbi:hypothetical protein Hdeb2414_s0014g00430541 [Helianthus debilis subsp. tardiflorus]